MLDELTLKKSLELAVTTERLGGAFYRTLAKKFESNQELFELLSILAKDEAAHEAQFRALLEKAPEEKDQENAGAKYQYLAAVSVSKFFEGEKGPLKNVENMKTRDDALAMAFQFEKESLLFYEGIKDIYGENESLQEIIDAEKGHLVSVMKYLLTGAKMRSLSDDW